MRACAFFSPSLDPMLDGGKGHKDPVVAPQVPTRWAVGQTVFDHEAARQLDHPVGILTARWSQIREVGAQVLATLRTVMLGIGHQQIARTPHVEIAQIMECPMRLLVPIGRVTTTRAWLPEVIATVGDDLGLGQVFGCGDPGAGVGSVLTWTEHRVALLAQRFGPELYDKRLLGATRYSRYSLRYFCWCSPPTEEQCMPRRPNLKTQLAIALFGWQWREEWDCYCPTGWPSRDIINAPYLDKLHALQRHGGATHGSSGRMDAHGRPLIPDYRYDPKATEILWQWLHAQPGIQ